MLPAQKAAKLDKASTEPGRIEAGTVTWAQVREIAELKMEDLNAASLEAADQLIAGTARSCGIVVE